MGLGHGRVGRTLLPVCSVVLSAAISIVSLAYLVRVEIDGGVVPEMIGSQSQRAPEQIVALRSAAEEPAFTGSIAASGIAAGARASRDAETYQVAPPADTLTAYLGDSHAALACEDRVREGLPFPNSFARLLDTTATRHVPGTGSVVTFNFDAVAESGSPIRMHAECVLDGARIARLQVDPIWSAASMNQSVFSIPPSTK